MSILESNTYPVFFEDNLASLAPFLKEKQYSSVIILTDRNTEEHCLPVLKSALPDLEKYDVIEVDPGEENKNIDFCIGVWKMLLDFGADRNTVLINLGGGVITDMGGFAASTFKRGIPFIQIPTTLLAQVDASVGGKTGIDLDHIKNIIGTFTAPEAVFISVKFLQTLTEQQLVSGFAEMIKHGLIYDRDLFDHLKTVNPKAVGSALVMASVKIKNEVVLADPKEKGLRKILNFGHTIGHALETYSLVNDPNPLLHGEAIVVGMICEAYLSYKVNGLPQFQLEEIITALRRIFPDYHTDKSIDEEVLTYMKNDKKNDKGKIGFSLLKEIGHCQFDFFLAEDLIKESLAFYRKTTAD